MNKEIEKKVTKNETNSKMNKEIKDEIKEAKETTLENKNNSVKKIGLASDHRGYHLKQKVTNYLKKKGYTVIDYGADSPVASDYPVPAFSLGKGITSGEVSKGIAICGSGIGISIACNKVRGVRCAKVNNAKEVKMARLDNDANVIAFSGKMPFVRVKDIIDVYLKTKFKGEERHQRRIEMLDNYKD